MDQATIESEVKSIKWWHRIDLGNGVITPGTADSEAKLAYIGLPERMDGMRVLDAGCWDGWWSFLCERRGAREVFAVDTWEFDTGNRGFALAQRTLKSKVVGRMCDIHRLDPSFMGTFDLVLCLGVLHHLKSPFLALEHLRSVCNGTLVLETHVDFTDVSTPLCAFYKKHGYKPYNDPTILWGPNPSCVSAWLEAAGFSSNTMVNLMPKKHPSLGDRAAFHAHVG
jgi:tRNA (mo5U34)-methyltransferase